MPMDPGILGATEAPAAILASLVVRNELKCIPGKFTIYENFSGVTSRNPITLGGLPKLLPHDPHNHDPLIQQCLRTPSTLLRHWISNWTCSIPLKVIYMQLLGV